MPLSTLNNGDSGSTCRTAINAAITAINNLGTPTTAGLAMLGVTNPGAITFPRFNADNSLTLLSASDFRTAIGAASLDAANAFTASQVINTASGSPFELKIANTQKFLFSSNGGLFISDSNSWLPYGIDGKFYLGGDVVCRQQGGGVNTINIEASSATSTDQNISWYISGVRSLSLYYHSANSLQLGVNDATTPTTQTIKAHNVTTGTGADLCLKGGTGSVANGNVRFGTHAAVGAETVTGYITIKDEGGTTRKLAVIS